jgi:hypothetical protein
VILTSTAGKPVCFQWLRKYLHSQSPPLVLTPHFGERINPSKGTWQQRQGMGSADQALGPKVEGRKRRIKQQFDLGCRAVDTFSLDNLEAPLPPPPGWPAHILLYHPGTCITFCPRQSKRGPASPVPYSPFSAQQLEWWPCPHPWRNLSCGKWVDRGFSCRASLSGPLQGPPPSKGP